MPIASNLSSGRITARYVLGVADGPDPDDEPDLIPAAGTVKFVPKVPYLVNVTADPAPMIALPAEVVGMLDSEGYLCTPSPTDPAKPGTRGVRLFATDDPDGSVTGWTWEATPRLITPAGITLAGAIPTTSFALPSGATLDLAAITKVPSSPGVGTDQAITLIVDLERRLNEGEFGGGSDPVPGKSTYDLAVDNGFTGTLTEWLDSLKGAPGSPATSAPVALLRASVSVAKTAGRQINIAFTGSSSTAGHNTTAAKRWVNLLASRITTNPVLADQQAYDQRTTLPPGLTVINAGINGATSATYLADGRDTRLAALNPTFIVHMIGSNDYGNNVTQTEYRANILAAIERVDTLNARPVAHLLVHSYERYDITPTSRTWAQYGDTLRAIAAERPDHIAFLDLSKAFRAVGIPSTDPLGLMQSDRLHMNDYGHAYFAELIASTLLFEPAAVTTPTNPVSTPVVADDFTRADGPLGVTPVGNKPWLYSAGTMSLVNGLVTASSANAGAFVDAGITNGTVGVTGSLASQGLIFRASSTGEGYYFMWSGGGQEYRVGRRSAQGAFTAILGTGTARTFTAGARYEVELNGSSIKCKVNGTIVLEITDTTYSGTHYGVVSASTTGAPLKNFQVAPPA